MSRPEPLDRAELPPGLWTAPVAIGWGDCDPAGIVFTPRYFEMFNRLVEGFYAGALGLDYHAILRERRIGLGYARAEADFLAPASHGDLLEAAVAVEAVGRSSYALRIHLFRGRAEAVRARLVTVATDLATHRPVPIPADLRAALAARLAAP